MNVTSNGYYSSQYLSEQQRKQPRYHYNYALNLPPSPKEFIVEVDEDDPAPYMPPMEFLPLQRQAFMNNVRPKTPKSQSESMISPPGSAHRSTSSLPIEYDDLEPDNQLEETITPAQLNYLQEQNHYVPYQPEPRQPYQPQQYYPPKQKYPKNKNNDYYIRQKKRYDKAQVVKPKLYSHKTFHDVFEDKTEKLDRYNPMDLVFEGKDTKDKLTFLEKMQTKLTKEKYDDYNYYDHRPKKSPVKEEIFVDNQSDDDEENTPEEVEVEEVVTVGEGKDKETKVIKKKVPLKKLMKKKFNQAKKELGRDFVDYSRRQKEINEKIKESKLQLKKKRELERAAEKEKLRKEQKEKASGEAKAEEKTFDDKKDDKKEEEEKKPDGEGEEKKDEKATEETNAGWWPYLASWLYYPEEEEEKKEDEKKEEDKDKDDSKKEDDDKDKEKDKEKKDDTKSVKKVVYPPTPFEKNMKKLKVFSKNSKVVFDNWNQPATKMFYRELLNEPRLLNALVISKKKSEQPLNALVMSKKNTEPLNALVVSKKKSEALIHPSNKSVIKVVEENGNPMEFIIECSDSEAESQLTQEMYYNPVTKQLETSPPTSSSSMISGEEEKDEVEPEVTTHGLQFDPNAPVVVISTWMNLIKRVQIMKMIFAPIDIIGEFIPGLQGLVVVIELLLFIWILYELSRLVNAICMMITAVCAPMIAVGKFMNRIV